MSDSVTLNGQELTAQELERVRKLLAEDAAVLVECVRLSPKGNVPVRRRMVRRWPRISDGERALCEAYLGTFASANNTSPCNTVNGPKADRETYAGAWRMIRTDLSRLQTDPTQQGVYQTLLWPADDNGGSGSLCEESSPLHHEDATVYADSDHIPDVAHRNEQGHIFRAQGNIDSETGRWSGKETDDAARTPDLYQTESRTAERVSITTKGEHQWTPQPAVTVATPAGVSSKGTPTVERTADMDAYGLWSTSQRDTWPVEFLKATADTSHPKHDEVEVSASNVDNVPSFDAVCTAASYSPEANLKTHAILTGFSVRGNEFGLLDVTASWRVPKAVQVVVSSAARTAESTAISVHWEHLRESELAGKHLTDATSDSMKAIASAYGGNTHRGGRTAGNATPTMMPDYAVGELRKELDEFGLWTCDFRVTVPASVVLAHANEREKFTDVEAVASNAEAVPTLDGVTAAARLSYPQELAAYAVLTGLSVRINEFGLADATLSWRVPKTVALVRESVQRSAAATTVTLHGEHLRESELAGNHLDDATAATMRAVADGNGGTTHRGGKIAQDALGTPMADYLSGELRRDMDEFGLWTAEMRVTVPWSFAHAAASERADHTEVEAVCTNYSGFPTLADAKRAGGLSYDETLVRYAIQAGLSFRMNEFGLLDVTATWRIPKAATKEHVDESVKYANVEVSAVNAEDIPTGWTGQVGGLVAYKVMSGLSFRMNEYGLFDATVSWRVPKEIEPWEDTIERPGESTTTITHYEHATTIPPPSAGVNDITEIRSSMDEFGLFSGETRVTVAIPTATVVSAEHPRWTEYDATFSNQLTIPSRATLEIPAALNAICTSQSARENEFGLYDGTQTWRIPKTVDDVDWTQVGNDPEGRRWQCWGWNKSAPLMKEKAAGVGDNSIIVSETHCALNEFGLWDYVGTATEEKHPYGGGSLSFTGGKTREKYVFIENHANATLNSSTGRWQGTSETTTVTYSAYSDKAAAATAANNAVTNKSAADTVKNHIAKHGRWWILESEVIHFNNG